MVGASSFAAIFPGSFAATEPRERHHDYRFDGHIRSCFFARNGFLVCCVGIQFYDLFFSGQVVMIISCIQQWPSSGAEQP